MSEQGPDPFADLPIDNKRAFNIQEQAFLAYKADRSAANRDRLDKADAELNSAVDRMGPEEIAEQIYAIEQILKNWEYLSTDEKLVYAEQYLSLQRQLDENKLDK